MDEKKGSSDYDTLLSGVKVLIATYDSFASFGGQAKDVYGPVADNLRELVASVEPDSVVTEIKEGK